MPMMNFHKAGEATIIRFDKDTGEHVKIKKHCTPGDVFEIAIEDMPDIAKRGIGHSPDRKAWDERQELLRIDEENARKREERNRRLTGAEIVD